LTAADATADAERSERDTPRAFEPCKDDSIGGIELTGDGFRKLSMIRVDLNQALFPNHRHEERFWYERANGRIEILSATEQGCHATIQHVTERLQKRGFKATHVDGPTRIGEWWRSRHELVPTGFRAWIHHDAPPAAGW
jgi:hypothetical protein